VYASVVTPRFEEVRKALDDSRNFANFTDSPYYFDALYETFSRGEFERRHNLVREFMAREGLDCLVVGGGPSHWSAGYGMGWLTGTRGSGIRLRRTSCSH